MDRALGVGYVGLSFTASESTTINTDGSSNQAIGNADNPTNFSPQASQTKKTITSTKAESTEAVTALFWKNINKGRQSLYWERQYIKGKGNTSAGKAIHLQGRQYV